MIKISGGELRGRNLKTPPGLGTRPTAAKVREALFAILGPRVLGARVADLFAGSGALGIEALSRGAAHCLFVEQSPQTARLLTQNIAALGLMGRAQVLTADAGRPLTRLKERGPFDLILADPPYDQGLVERVAGLVLAEGWLAPAGVLVIEHAPRERPGPPVGLGLTDRRAYGQTELSFLERLDSGKA